MADNILVAIEALYGPSYHTNSNKQAINQSLVEWQKLPTSWPAAFELLHHSNHPNAQFFGALTLHVKITRDMYIYPIAHWLHFSIRINRCQLEPEARDQLRTTLIQELCKSAPEGYSSIVKRKLCLSLVGLVLHHRQQSGGERSTVTDVFEKLASGGSLVAPLEYLRMLPEEFHRTDLIASEKFAYSLQELFEFYRVICRAHVNGELVKAFPRVLEFLESLLDQVNIQPDEKVLTLACIQSWIRFEAPMRMLPSIISKTVRQLHDPQSFESAVEVLIDLISNSQSIHYENSICESLMGTLTSGWFPSHFYECIENDCDDGFVKSACQLLCAFGEAFTTFLIKNCTRPEIVVLLQMLLRATNYPGYFGQDEEISDLPLSFWYTLHDTLLDSVHLPSMILPNVTVTAAAAMSMNESGMYKSIMSMDSSTSGLVSVSSSIEALPDESAYAQSTDADHSSGIGGERMQQIRSQFERVFLELLPILRRKSVFPSDTEWNHWSADTRVKFRNYRRDLADTVAYCHYIIHENAFRLLVEMIPQQTTDACNWQELEATLFCIRSLADVAGDREKPFITQSLRYLHELIPRSPPRLVQTCVSLLGTYAHWLNAHDPLFVFKAIEYIMPCMQSFNSLDSTGSPGKNLVGAKPGLSAAPDLAITAFRSFREICDACRTKLVHMIDQLVASFLGDQFELIKPSNNRIQFADSIAQIIQATSPAVQASVMSSIVQCIAFRIQSILQNSNVDPLAACVALAEQLDCLNAFLRGIQQPAEDAETGIPITLPADERAVYLATLRDNITCIWPVLSAVMQAAINNEEIIQRMQTFTEITCGPFNSRETAVDPAESMFLLPEFSSQYCEVFSNFMADGFDRYRHPLWLDSAATLLQTFGPYAEQNAVQLAYDFRQRIPAEASWIVCQNLAQTTQRLTHRLTAATLNSLLGDGVETVSEHRSTGDVARMLDQSPDLTEALFSFLETCVKRNSAALLAGQSLPFRPLFYLSVSALEMHERKAFKSNIQFLITLINVSSVRYQQPRTAYAPKQIVDSIVQSIGAQLTDSIVVGLVERIPRSNLPLVADLLFKLIHVYPQVIRIWLKEAMAKVSRPDQKDKDNAVKEMLGTRSIRRFKEIVKEFCIKARGLDGSAFGVV